MALPPQCQCSKKCRRAPLPNEPFCSYHKLKVCPISPITGSEPDNNILDEYNTIYYVPPGLPWPSAPISLNLSKVSNSWFNISNDSIMEFFDESTSKLSEEYEQRLII